MIDDSGREQLLWQRTARQTWKDWKEENLLSCGYSVYKDFSLESAYRFFGLHKSTRLGAHVDRIHCLYELFDDSPIRYMPSAMSAFKCSPTVGENHRFAWIADTANWDKLNVHGNARGWCSLLWRNSDTLQHLPLFGVTNEGSKHSKSKGGFYVIFYPGAPAFIGWPEIAYWPFYAQSNNNVDIIKIKEAIKPKTSASSVVGSLHRVNTSPLDPSWLQKT